MLEALVNWLVKHKLKHFFASTGQPNLELELRNGRLLLRDVELNGAAVSEALDLPLVVTEARVQMLEVLLPWRESPPAPLVVRIHGARLVLAPLDTISGLARLDSWRRQQHLRRIRASSASRAMGMGKSDGSSGGGGGGGGSSSSSDRSPTLEPWQMRALVDALLRDVHISLTDISLCYGHAVGGPAITVQLQSFVLHAQRRQALPRLLALCFRPGSSKHNEHSCDCTFQIDFRVQWHPHGHDATDNAADSSTSFPSVENRPSSASAASHILSPCTLRGEMLLRIEWPPVPAPVPVSVADASVTPPSLHVQGSVSLSRVQFRLTSQQLAYLAHTLRVANEPNVALAHRAASREDGASPDHDAPMRSRGGATHLRARLRWRHAARAIGDDLRRVRQRVSWRWLRARGLMQRAYELLLQQSAVKGTSAVRAHTSTAEQKSAESTALEAALRKARIAANEASSGECDARHPIGVLRTRSFDAGSSGGGSSGGGSIDSTAGGNSGAAGSASAQKPTAATDEPLEDPIAWLESVLDLPSIQGCHERVEQRLAASNQAPSKATSASISQSSNIDVSVSPTYWLKLNFALQLKVEGAGASVELPTNREDGAARLELYAHGLGADIQHGMALGAGGARNRSLSSELSASLEDVWALHWQRPSSQTASAVSAAWTCASVLGCSVPSAVGAATSGSTAAGGMPASWLPGAESRPASAPLPFMQLTSHLEVKPPPAALNAGLAVVIARPLTLSADLALCTQLAALTATFAQPPMTTFSLEPKDAVLTAFGVADHVAGFTSKHVAPSPQRPLPDQPQPGDLRRPQPKLSVQLDVCEPLLVTMTAAEQSSLSVPLVQLQRLHVSCQHGFGSEAQFWMHVTLGASLAQQHSVLPLLVSKDVAQAATVAKLPAETMPFVPTIGETRFGRGELDDGRTGLLGRPAQGVLTGNEEESDADSDGSAPVAEIVISSADLADSPRSPSISMDGSAPSPGTPSAERRHRRHRSDSWSTEPSLQGGHRVPSSLSPSPQKAAPSQRSPHRRVRSFSEGVASPPLGTHSGPLSPSSRSRASFSEGVRGVASNSHGSSPVERLGGGSRLNMLERFTRAAVAPSVELAIAIIINPDYADEIDDEEELGEAVRGEEDDHWGTHSTLAPNQHQLLAVSSELLVPCTFAGLFALPTPLLVPDGAIEPTEEAADPATQDASPSATRRALRGRAGSRQHPRYGLTLSGSLPVLRVNVWPSAIKHAAELVTYGVGAVSKLAERWSHLTCTEELAAYPCKSEAAAVGATHPSRPSSHAPSLCEVNLQLHLQLIELQLHHSPARPPASSLRRSASGVLPLRFSKGDDSADLLLVRVRSLTICAEAQIPQQAGSPPTATLQTYVHEITMLDCRSHVPMERASLLLLKGSPVLPPSRDLRAAVRLISATEISSTDSTSKAKDWRLPASSLVPADPEASGTAGASLRPLLALCLSPPQAEAPDVLPLRMFASCRSVAMQWNPLLFATLVRMGVDLAHSIAEINTSAEVDRPARAVASTPSATPSATPPATPPAAPRVSPAALPPWRLALSLEGTVYDVNLSLNAEDHIGDLDGSAAPLTLSGKPAMRRMESLVNAHATPDVLQLVLVTCSQVQITLTMAPSTDIALRLDAVLGGIRCPVHSPPAPRTFEMVMPLDPKDAGVTVHIVKNETTAGLPDITVESTPVVFEYRNQSLLQAVDFIDRCIIGVFAPLRDGPKPPSQPLWRVHVPSARMLMPTGGWWGENAAFSGSEGVIEFVIGKASVGNSVLTEPTKTQRIAVTAANVSAYITRKWTDATSTAAEAATVAADDHGSSNQRRVPKPTSPKHRTSRLPLIEELSEVRLVMKTPLRKVEGALHGQPFMDLEILPVEGTVHLGLQPADTRTIMALWFDNMSRNYNPPPDLAKMALERETTKGMAVRLSLEQVVIWMCA